MTQECQVHMREAVIADRRETGFVNPLRVHKSLTAAAEKRALVWMAWRTPRAINSDHLTGLGFVSQLMAGAYYALASQGAWALMLASFFLVLNWLGDSLDGTLARVRDQQRPRYGFYVDHMADTFGALALMAGLACSGYVHWQIAASMLEVGQQTPIMVRQEDSGRFVLVEGLHRLEACRSLGDTTIIGYLVQARKH